jgi:hypothetical protein
MKAKLHTTPITLMILLSILAQPTTPARSPESNLLSLVKEAKDKHQYNQPPKIRNNVDLLEQMISQVYQGQQAFEASRETPKHSLRPLNSKTQHSPRTKPKAKDFHLTLPTVQTVIKYKQGRKTIGTVKGTPSYSVKINERRTKKIARADVKKVEAAIKKSKIDHKIAEAKAKTEKKMYLPPLSNLKF